MSRLKAVTTLLWAPKDAFCLCLICYNLTAAFGGEEGMFSSVAFWDKKGPRPPEDKEGQHAGVGSTGV